MISFLFSFEIINVVVLSATSEERLDPDTFSRIATPVADAAAVNLNGIKNAFSYYFNYISYSGQVNF